MKIKRGLFIGMVMLLLAIVVPSASNQISANAPVVAGVYDDVYSLPTPSGYITFRVLPEGLINVCSPGALCKKIALSTTVYRLGQVSLAHSQLVLVNYIGSDGINRQETRGLYELEDLLARE